MLKVLFVKYGQSGEQKLWSEWSKSLMTFLCLHFCQPMSEEHLIDLVDNDWRNEKLPNEDILLPLNKLPDPEENENQTSLKDQVSFRRKLSTAYPIFNVSPNNRKTNGLILQSCHGTLRINSTAASYKLNISENEKLKFNVS